MGNTITSRYPTQSEPLRMDNGLTASVFDALVLAAFELSTGDWETKLAQWLAEHDQARVGVGKVAIDLADLGWTPAGFADEKRFVLEVIDAAAHQTGWDRLPFQLEPARVSAPLAALAKLVSRIDRGVTAVADKNAKNVHTSSTSGVCDVHRVGLHEMGCIVCNSAPRQVGVAHAPYRASRVEHLVSLASQALIVQKQKLQFPLEWYIIGSGTTSTVYVNDLHRADVEEGGVYATLTVTFSLADEVLSTAHYHSNKSVAGDSTLPVDVL